MLCSYNNFHKQLEKLNSNIDKFDIYKEIMYNIKKGGVSMKKAFTIIELVITIAVISILTAVLIPTFSYIIDKASESKAVQEITSVLKETFIEIEISDDVVVLYYDDTQIEYIFTYKDKELEIIDYSAIDFNDKKMLLDDTRYDLIDTSSINNFPDHIKLYNKYIEILPTSITISGLNTLYVDETIVLSPTIYPSNAENKDVSWSVNDESIVEINEQNNLLYVTGINEGTVTIEAKSLALEDITCIIEITVIEKEDLPEIIYPESITIEAINDEIYIGDTFTCNASINPADVENKAVFWIIDESILQIDSFNDENNLSVTFTAVGLGSTKIKVTSMADANIFYEIDLIIKEILPVSITIDSLEEININDTFTLYANINPVETTNKNVFWNIDESIFQIESFNDENNLSVTLKVIDFGKTKVKVTSVADNNIFYEMDIEINEILPKDINIVGQDIDLYVGDIVTYAAEILPLNAYNRSILWEVDDDTIASIVYDVEDNSKVNIEALKTGETTIRVISQRDPSIFKEFNIKVEEILPTSISISGPTTVEEFSTIHLNASIIPSNVTNDNIIWYSTNESIATVSNGYVTGVSEGTVEIMAVCASDNLIFAEVKITVTKLLSDIMVEIECEKQLYIGYKAKATAKVYPDYISQEVIWEVHASSKNLATISEDGTITALAEGIFRFRARSKIDSTKKSNYFSLKINGMPIPNPTPDLRGYDIVIMTDESDISNVDPFNVNYKGLDKPYKQAAWVEVEEGMNCHILVKPYPEEAPFGQTRVNWIIDKALNKTSECDIAVVSSSWIDQFANANAAVDVTEAYYKYASGKIEPVLKSAGSYSGKLYVTSVGISQTKTYVDLGLYYNYGWLKELGVESPAKMFNEGRWTYTDFTNWVIDIQSKLGENEYVLGGAPYYYWYGMTHGAGQYIVNKDALKTNVTSQKSVVASNVIYNLVQKGCVNTNVTWSESNDVPNSFWRTDGGGTLMTTGYMNYINDKWSDSMWGEGTTEYGYVPFPYPDDEEKDCSILGLTELNVYMVVNGRSYPSDLGINSAWKIMLAVNQMFENTIKYQEEEPLFNAKEIVEGNLRQYIDDPNSIDAIMFYDSSKVVYSPTHMLGNYIKDSLLVTAANNVMFKGNNYMDEFNAIYEEETEFYGNI